MTARFRLRARSNPYIGQSIDRAFGAGFGFATESRATKPAESFLTSSGRLSADQAANRIETPIRNAASSR